MPLHLFYTMVQKSQKWPKTQIKGGGGGPALTQYIGNVSSAHWLTKNCTCVSVTWVAVDYAIVGCSQHSLKCAAMIHGGK